MALIPFSRETMRSLKAQKDDEINVMKIDYVVNQIYCTAVHLAETKADTMYRFIIVAGNNNYGTITIPSSLPSNAHRHTLQIISENIVTNMEEILARLRSLFPGCLVEYKKVSMATGRDGKEYDISALDDKVRPFIDTSRARINEYIVIEWS